MALAFYKICTFNTPSSHTYYIKQLSDNRQISPTITFGNLDTININSEKEIYT